MNVDVASAVRWTGKGLKPSYEHCPICVNSMISPKDGRSKPALIFLDMDGVMIGDRFRHALRSKICSTLREIFPTVKRYNDYHWTIAKGRHLHPVALMNLDLLIKRIEKSGQRALVILSTAWRSDATLKQLREEAFVTNKFCKYICGKTAPESSETSWTPECELGFDFAKGAKKIFGLNLFTRSDVIEFWMRDHCFDPKSTNFVVIDDYDEDKSARFGDRFIKTSYLFEKEHLELATSVLKV